MRTLTDVYIKVTHGNISDLRVLLNYNSLDINDNLFFHLDDAGSFDFCETNSLLDKKKVSLSELKRLIDTTPTREEITRLKRQISAYKTNYDKVVKHSLSKEDVIEELQRKLNRERSTTTDLFKQRKEVQLNHCKQIRTLAQEIERLKNSSETTNVLNTNLTTENNNLRRINKELQKHNEKLTSEKDNLKHRSIKLRELNDVIYKDVDRLTKENAQLKHDIKKVRSERDSLNVSFKKFNEMYDNALKKLDIQADLIRDKNAQIKQLKQRKFWQFWK